jgi:tRNA A-37 threonylcarbamoyl transferase component Bud32
MYKVTNLNEESGFNSLLDHYDRNKNKEWHTWLRVKSIFPRSGKQGLVGILESKKTPQEARYVFKVSQYINYLVQHELTVMRALNDLGPFCPHFCKGIGGVLADVDPKVRKEGNPFQITTKYPVEKEVLLMQYLDKTTKLYNYIRSSRISDAVLHSAIKQTLLATAIAQRKKKFTHYDLHSNNIMMKRCSKNLVFLYILDEQNQYCVPTHGHYPVIIDFGFSYAESLNDGPMWPSMGHTDIGFTSDRFDPVADPKLFLVTVSGELVEKRPNKTNRRLRNIVKNVFAPLTIDWQSGWDQGVSESAADQVLKMIHDYNTESELFDKYDHFCIDIIQSLIVLPLQEQNYSTINKSYKAFLNEFVKIERELGNPFYCLYVLKGIIDTAREVRSDYINKSSRQHAITHFQNCVYECIDMVSTYCRPKDVHFEKMLCSLLCLARNMEGVFYDILFPRTVKKNREYSKLPLQTIEQMYAVLEVNVPDNYEFNENTTVLVMDCVNETCEHLYISEEDIEEINDTDPLCRGTVLYGLFAQKNKVDD